MDLDQITQSVLDFVRHNQGWAPVIVAALAFGESLAVVSVLLPATVVLVGIGALIGAADLAFWPIWLGAVVGGSLGDWVSYEFGRYLGPAAKDRWPMNKQAALVARAEAFINRYGTVGVFLGRFFGPLRALVPLIAGIFGMPRLPFQAANITSALLWATGLLAPGAGLLAFLRG